MRKLGMEKQHNTQNKPTLTTNKLLTLKYFCSTTNNTKTENNPPEEYPFPRFEHLNRNNHLPKQKAEKRLVEVDRLRTNDRTRKKRRKKDEEMSHTKHVRKQTKICNLTTNWPISFYCCFYILFSQWNSMQWLGDPPTHNSVKHIVGRIWSFEL